MLQCYAGFVSSAFPVNSRKIKEMTTGELFVPLFTLFTLSLLSKIVCSLCYNDMLQKVTSKNPAILAFVCYRQNPVSFDRYSVNATHAQLLEKMRPIALAEMCRFLAIQ